MGTCSICGKDFSVTVAGIMRKHTRTVWTRTTKSSAECEGSGMTPKGTTTRFPARSFTAQQKAYNKLGLPWPPVIKERHKKK